MFLFFFSGIWFVASLFLISESCDKDMEIGKKVGVSISSCVHGTRNTKNRVGFTEGFFNNLLQMYLFVLFFFLQYHGLCFLVGTVKK